MKIIFSSDSLHFYILPAGTNREITMNSNSIENTNFVRSLDTSEPIAQVFPDTSSHTVPSVWESLDSDYEEEPSSSSAEENISKSDERKCITCAVCLFDVDKCDSSTITLPCFNTHMFHYHCLHKAVTCTTQHQCPLCRKSFDRNVLRNHPFANRSFNYHQPSIRSLRNHRNPFRSLRITFNSRHQSTSEITTSQSNRGSRRDDDEYYDDLEEYQLYDIVDGRAVYERVTYVDGRDVYDIGYDYE